MEVVEGIISGLSVFGRASGIRVFVEGMAAALLNGWLDQPPTRKGAPIKLTLRFLHDSQAR